MRKLIHRPLLLTLIVFFSALSVSGNRPTLEKDDIPNSKDHPLVSRYEGSWIVRYNESQFDEFSYPTSPELVNYNQLKDFKTVEGAVTFIEYETPVGVTASQVFGPMKRSSARRGLGNAMVGAQGSVLVASGLETIATYLKSHPHQSVLVVGHTDNTGDYRYNLELSQRRAQAVVQALTSNFGVQASQVEAVGVGMAAPLAHNGSEEGRQQNRRVELVLR